MDRGEHGEQEVISRAIVIGSSGQVAAALRASLKARSSEVLSSSSRGIEGTLPLDLANPESIRDFFRSAEIQFNGRPAEVFLAGAMTHVDRCEQEQDLCRRMNEEGPAMVAAECKARGHSLTFFSTEYVFGDAEYHGGSVGPFSETADPSPTSYYGKCKLAAEKRIQEIFGDAGALLVRTTMVYSWAPQGNNFLMQYYKQLREQEAGRKPDIFRIPEDQISTPTYAPALAEGSCYLREKNARGIFNIVGSDLLSRRELVEKVIASFGFDPSKGLEAFRFLKTAELGQAARRPLTAGLTMEKAKAFGVKIVSLDEAFREILRDKK